MSRRDENLPTRSYPNHSATETSLEIESSHEAGSDKILSNNRITNALVKLKRRLVCSFVVHKPPEYRVARNAVNIMGRSVNGGVESNRYKHKLIDYTHRHGGEIIDYQQINATLVRNCPYCTFKDR